MGSRKHDSPVISIDLSHPLWLSTYNLVLADSSTLMAIISNGDTQGQRYVKWGERPLLSYIWFFILLYTCNASPLLYVCLHSNTLLKFGGKQLNDLTLSVLCKLSKAGVSYNYYLSYLLMVIFCRDLWVNPERNSQYDETGVCHP